MARALWDFSQIEKADLKKILNEIGHICISMYLQLERTIQMSIFEKYLMEQLLFLDSDAIKRLTNIFKY